MIDRSTPALRVLLVNSTCKVGGVSTFLVSLHGELRRMGHSGEMFFFERGPMEPNLPSDARVHFGDLADLMRLVARAHIDVVHANNVDWPTGISAVRRLGARLVLTAHKVREPAWTYGWTRQNCDAFVAVSQWIRHGLQAFTDMPIEVVHNGIDTRRYRADEAVGTGAGPIVAWIGRAAAPRKRLEAFAAIAPALQRAGCRVWIIDQQGPKQFAARCPEDARVLEAAAERWEGVPFDSMPGCYQAIAASGGCVVSTASMEGLPLTLLEAQACGCPVIGPAVHGVEECVRPEHGGTLYPPGLPADALAGLVLQALADPGATRTRGRQAADFVAAAFSLHGMASRYTDLYRRTPPGDTMAKVGSRHRHSPLLHWHAYLDERLGVGHAQYAASHVLASSGDLEGAAAAAREALATAPTMYVRPERLAYLLKLSRRAGARK